MKDTYKTIAASVEGILFKEKNSKFYGYAYAIRSEEDIKKHLSMLKKQHHAARHWCYAWQLGTDPIRYRANDDGEPSNTAGMPIYGQIQSFEVTNIILVVVRYFGGVKLGVGGLIQAYRTTAKMTLATSDIITKTITTSFIITFKYEHMNIVMRIIKEHQLDIITQKMEFDCQFTIAVRIKNATLVKELFEHTHGIEIHQEEI